MQQKIGDQRRGDLHADGVECTEETADLERLLDPAKEQLHRPAALVERGDLFGRGVEIVADDAQDFPVSILTWISRSGSSNGLRPLRAGGADRIRQDGAAVRLPPALFGIGLYGLQPRDDAAALCVEAAQKAKS